MAGLNGTFAARMGEGRIQNGLLDFMSADVLKAITPWSKGDDGIRIGCVTIDHVIQKGQLKSRATVIDTNRLAIIGSGGVNLVNEEISFGIVPHAQTASLMALLVPLRVGGTLASPSVLPDPAAIAAGTVKMVTSAIGGAAGMVGGLLGAGGGEKKTATKSTDPCVAKVMGQTQKSAPAKTEKPASGGTSSSPSSDPGKMLDDATKGIRGLFGR